MLLEECSRYGSGVGEAEKLRDLLRFQSVEAVVTTSKGARDRDSGRRGRSAEKKILEIWAHPDVEGLDDFVVAELSRQDGRCLRWSVGDRESYRYFSRAR